MDVLTNHFRERMIACLMGHWAADDMLLQYAADADGTAIRESLAVVTALPVAEQPSAWAEQRQQICTASDVVLLGDVHPSWLVDRLTHEAPRVVGLLLRFLPSRHARYVLEHLPQHLREQLPSVVDAFAVPDGILRMIRQRFESHFLPTRVAIAPGAMTFRDLPALSLDEIAVVIHDLGVEELALALRHLPKSALRVLLNRMPFAEGKVLAERMRTLPVVDAVLERDARYSILELNFERSSAENLIREVGVQALAKAMLPGDLGMLGRLKQKMAPDAAYLLQREIDAHIPAAGNDLAALRQRRVMARLAELAHERVIDPDWTQKLPVRAAGDHLPEMSRDSGDSSFQQAS